MVGSSANTTTTCTTNRLGEWSRASAGQLGDLSLDGDEDDFLTSHTMEVGLIIRDDGLVSGQIKVVKGRWRDHRKQILKNKLITQQRKEKQKEEGKSSKGLSSLKSKLEHK